MGLPALNFSYRKAAETVAARLKQGVVALILRDATLAPGVYPVVYESDIPAALGTANQAAVKRTMLGYISAPSKILLSVIDADDAITGAVDQLTGFTYDYIAGPDDLSAEDATALKTKIVGLREGLYVGKAILPNTAADNEGVINFTADELSAPGLSSAAFSTAAYCGRIAGIFAGTPMGGSATGAPLPEVVSVRAASNLDAAVDSGQLVAYHNGRRVVLGRAVTSKTSFASGEPEALKKVKIVEAIDLIRYNAVAVAQDEFLGVCANSYNNKMILVSALNEFMAQLQAEGVVEEGTWSVSLDADAIRAHLRQQGVIVTDMSDDDIRRADTGSFVYIVITGRILDAMEDFSVRLVLLNN